MKKIKTISIEVLEAIEDIVSDDFMEDMEYKIKMGRCRDKDEEIAIHKLLEVYRIAHGSNPNHICHDSHLSWDVTSKPKTKKKKKT